MMDNTVIEINSKIYTLPSSNFTEINDVKSQGRMLKEKNIKYRLVYEVMKSKKIILECGHAMKSKY